MSRWAVTWTRVALEDDMPGSVAALAGVRAGLSPSWATRMDGSNGWSVPFGKRDSTAPAH